MFDLKNLSASGHQQILVASLATFATGLGIYYTLAPSKKATLEEKSVYRSIPVPKSRLPYFGHLFSLGELPGNTVTKWNKELGPIIQLDMGQQTWIVLSDPKLAHEIFMTNGAVTSDRPPHTFFDFFSHGGIGVVFSNANKNWKKSRTSVLSVLAPSRVNEFTDLLLYETDNLVEELLARTSRHGQLNCLTTINACALNVVLTIIFGKRVTSADDPFLKELMKYIEPTLKYAGVEGSLSQHLPAFDFVDSLFGKKRTFRDFIANVRDPLFRSLIREAATGDKDCLVKDYMELDFEELDLIVILSDLLAAGTDTISVTLSWLIAILSHQPEVQKKLHEEIDTFVNAHGRLPTFEERDQVPYLVCVQKECMRYRSTSSFGLPHTTREDVVIRDYMFPKGTVLLANMKGMHMNPDIYDDPETFKPERFMGRTRTMYASANGNVDKRDHFNFGFGRRICPGIHMAEVEMYHACTRIFGRCVIAPPLDTSGNEVPIDIDAAVNSGVVVAPAPFEVRFLPRTDSPLESLSPPLV